MEPQEIIDRVKATAKAVGPKAEVMVYISENSRGLSVSLYPSGVGSNRHRIHVNVPASEGWAALFDALDAKWAGERALHFEATIKAMALKIIEITSDRGFCSDSALRMQFDQSEIDQFGDEAITRANAMADKGPFSITRLAGANAGRLTMHPLNYDTYTR